MDSVGWMSVPGYSTDASCVILGCGVSAPSDMAEITDLVITKPKITVDN